MSERLASIMSLCKVQRCVYIYFKRQNEKSYKTSESRGHIIIIYNHSNITKKYVLGIRFLWWSSFTILKSTDSIRSSLRDDEKCLEITNTFFVSNYVDFPHSTKFEKKKKKHYLTSDIWSNYFFDILIMKFLSVVIWLDSKHIPMINWQVQFLWSSVFLSKKRQKWIFVSSWLQLIPSES